MEKHRVVKIEERLDAENASVFKEKIEKLINTEESEIILDFSNTKFIDSIGLGSLVSMLKQTANKKISIVLCSLSPQVRQIFELTKLYRLFEIFDSMEEAERAM